MNPGDTDHSGPDPFRADALLPVEPAQSGPSSGKAPPLIRINADAIADAASGVIAPGSIVLRRERHGYEIIDSGTRARIDRLDLPDPMFELSLRDRLVVPALVNAHTHLDLSHLGPLPHDPDDGFVSWIDMIRSGRLTDDGEIARAVGMGIASSLRGGTIGVGDIAGAPSGRLTDAPALALAQSPLFGVSYLEFFGIGRSAAGAVRKVEGYLHERYPETHRLIAGRGVEIGLQPHAPNTVDMGVYNRISLAAAARGIPLSTHLAETLEEREFIADASGPQRELLERLGVWDDSTLDHIGGGEHPVEHLRGVLEHAPMLVAHVNDASDHAIEILGAARSSVAYCPRASVYFGADKRLGAHRYRDMLRAGVNVCLGTDSVVNLDTQDRISVLDEMRLLSKRDAVGARTLLSMGTINGARALGLDERAFSLRPGARPLGLIAIPCAGDTGDPWRGAMRSTGAPDWVFLRKKQREMRP